MKLENKIIKLLIVVYKIAYVISALCKQGVFSKYNILLLFIIHIDKLNSSSFNSGRGY